MTPDEAMVLIRQERARQEVERKGLPRASDPDLDWPLKLSALMEEVGEVARALNDDVPPLWLQTELVQVAAVAFAWLESRPLILPGQEVLAS